MLRMTIATGGGWNWLQSLQVCAVQNMARRDTHSFVHAWVEINPCNNDHHINTHINSLDTINLGDSGQAHGRQEKGMTTKIKRRMVDAHEMGPRGRS